MAHLVVGALLVGLGLWGIFSWWGSFGLVMRGLVPFALLSLGLVAVLSGAHRLSSDEDDEAEGPAKEGS